MINDILTNAGFELNKTFKETRFLTPPKTTFAVYMLDIDRYGGDDFNAITNTSITIELYEYKVDKDAEKRIEQELDNRGLEFTKQARYWIDSEQLYQVIYEFNYTIKEVIKHG